NPVKSLYKLWKDAKKEFPSVPQTPYSQWHHELVAPPPLPPMQQPQQQQPYPQPGQYQQHPQGMHPSAPLTHVPSGLPVFGSSTPMAANTSSTNPFDDPAPAPAPAYNPAHLPLYIPEPPTQRQQQQQQSIPAPSAPPGQPW
ncbi:hypothetical protein BGZ95_006866, partial [Linnemannia exigua]